MNDSARMLMLSATVFFSAAASAAEPTGAVDLAKAFGAQQRVVGPELSPDGKRVVYIGPGVGTTNIVYIADVATGISKPITRADGKPLRVVGCGWSANDRLICSQFGIARDASSDAKFVPYSRLLALDSDGKNIVALGRRSTGEQLYSRQFDGEIIDWLNGADGRVLMTRYYVPEMTTGTRTASTKEGYGVDLVDTRTTRTTSVEAPRPDATYWSDGRGVVRLMARFDTDNFGQLTSKVTYSYRTPEDKQWRVLSAAVDRTEFAAVGVDSGTNSAYVLKPLDGRDALYRISLDGSAKTELVFSHPDVDVEGVVTIGRQGRVIGASYATDKPHVEYFEPKYKALAAGFARAVPHLPLISFVSADAAEKTLLISAASDDDPGHFYIYDRETRSVAELLLVRPQLQNVKLAKVQAVDYKAKDGTRVPAYLTLPPGAESAKGLPALVMPHGGPAARDIWGFDWLAQYYAVQGFAVLQPNFRGSAGYGSEWFVKNGFRSWPVAVGDVLDGGRWLVSQGIADPKRLGVIGWSYGGYAALQANVVDPALFKAVVAIAPVTDLELLKNESRGFTNARLTRDLIGSGTHVEEGSPARHAGRFTAPVLLFHGDTDANVDVYESQVMDKALKSNGKASELIVYPGLDHQLYDDAAREDMLKRSHEFLSRSLR
jgi:dipeptidyl aminopeptidase/acylaminoacyl peptidase